MMTEDETLQQLLRHVKVPNGEVTLEEAILKALEDKRKKNEEGQDASEQLTLPF